MNEIKCPNCGKVFQVDEAGYAAIVAQVHTEQFEKEIADRLHAAQRELEARQRVALAEETGTPANGGTEGPGDCASPGTGKKSE